ncbi:MAG: UDP-2,3-diacylglucosamine hydrolase, partial [Campylobacterales bacterium]|nr:UDP-2,3-diacylglucosamine hydrolase [Campylobacterales bacterium]
PHIKVFQISEQPVEFDFHGKKVLFAHGDIDSPFLYRIYVSIIRNRFILYFLDKLNRLLKNMILNKLDTYLAKKEDCNDFENFRAFIEKRLAKKYSCYYFIEGHFHQNKTIIFEDFSYINIGAFACNQRYFSVESLQKLELTQEKYS